MIIELPYPPSANTYWRKWKNRMVIGKPGREYRDAVSGAVCGLGAKPIASRIAMAIDAHMPDLRRRDLDNIQKPTLDALQHAGLYEDDSQVDWLLTVRRAKRQGGAICVTLESMPVARCLACGSAKEHWTRP